MPVKADTPTGSFIIEEGWVPMVVISCSLAVIVMKAKCRKLSSQTVMCERPWFTYHDDDGDM
jgi:hypothetical protein